MRLNSLQLRPYGSLSDAALELGEGLTVVYGLNEAGKSTLQSAYADLLVRNHATDADGLPGAATQTPHSGHCHDGRRLDGHGDPHVEECAQRSDRRSNVESGLSRGTSSADAGA